MTAQVHPALRHLSTALTALALGAASSAQITNGFIEERVERNFQHLGVRVIETKALDQKTGEDIYFATDLSGAPVDLAALQAAELELSQQPGAKIHPDLLAALATQASVEVAIWLNFDPAKMPKREAIEAARASGASVDDAIAEHRLALMEQNRQLVETQIVGLAQRGVSITSRSQFAPAVFAVVNAQEIELIAEMNGVDRLYPVRTHEDLGTQVNGHGTHRWHRASDFGVRADGIQVAVIENNGVTSQSGDLLNVSGYNSNLINVDNHASGTASIIGSTSATWPGHVRGVEILSGNAVDSNGNASYNDDDIVDATDWAISSGADVVNMSFGQDLGGSMAFLDRYVDYQVRFTATTIVIAAGNDGTGSGNVGSPATAWNCIAVGNVNDQGTSDWSDDVMAATSSFVDPSSGHNDRQKPEVSAVGTNIQMIGSDGTYSYVASGTSMAAPAVAGMAAAVMQDSNHTGDLRYWPEAIRALVMASATHNVEGSSDMSDVDGAGSLNGLQLYRMVEKGQYLTKTFTDSSFNSNDYYLQNIYLQGGDLTRVALSWDSSADSSYGTDVLDADFDLAVLQGYATETGTVMDSSSSWDNSHEIVEFEPPTTGWYTIRVRKWRFDGTSEYAGMAWTQHVDGRHARIRQFLPELSSNLGPQVGTTYFGIRPEDAVNPGQDFMVHLSYGKNVGYDLQGDRHSYANWDLFAQLSTQYPTFFGSGLMGTLSNTGGYNSSLRVTDNAVWRGFPLLATMMTRDPSFPDGVREIAAVEEMRIWGKPTDQFLGDDDSVEVNLGMTFPFYGQNWSSVWINSNGNLTFGQGDTDYNPTTIEIESGPPRIMPFWRDLDPTAGGHIRTRLAGDHFVIEFSRIPEYGTTSVNSVIVVLKSDGEIELRYRRCDLTTGFAGIAPGSNSCNSSVNPDINHGLNSSNSGGALFEEFTSQNPFDLDTYSFYRNTVRFRMVSGGSCPQYRVTVDLAD